MFVEPWTYGVDIDPGLPGFLHQHRQIFKDDTEASSKRFSKLIIGARLVQFFNSENPTPEEMYARRGILAQEARTQEKKAEASALLGIPYAPPRQAKA
eukprot:9719960-Heterocapsa_arctica.AAC.1